MAPSQVLPPRHDPFDSSTTTGQQTREAPGSGESFGDTTWAVVAIVLGAFLMVTLIIFGVLYYQRWRQLARLSAAAAAGETTTAAATVRGGEGVGVGGGSNNHLWGEAAPADAQLRHHRSRLRLDAAGVVGSSLASAAAAAAAGAPKRLRRMTEEDRAEAHELERALMIRKSLASRESWGSTASHNTLVSNNHNRNVSGSSSNSNNSSSSSSSNNHHHHNRSVSGNSNNASNINNNNNNSTSETDGRGTPASRYRSHESLKSWEAGADGSQRNSRVLLPAASAESLRGHPALEAAPGTATRPVPPAPEGLQRKLMSPLPPLPNAHTR